jgi:hypothetical protein
MIERHFQIPFVASLALAEKQIQQNYRPLIAIHKWFARRPGTLFRALLLSELDGQSVEQTKRAERIPGFDQAPDFIIPDEFHPNVVIEAKLTEDDGTARDKATRIIRLCQMAEQRHRDGLTGYQVVACLAGRGFGVRRADMRQMLVHTSGKVFTPQTLDRIVACTDLSRFQTKEPKRSSSVCTTCEKRSQP